MFVFSLFFTFCKALFHGLFSSSFSSHFQLKVDWSIYKCDQKSHESQAVAALSEKPRLDKKTFCYETCGSKYFFFIIYANKQSGLGEPIFIHNSFTRAIQLFFWQISLKKYFKLIIYLREFVIQIESWVKPRARFDFNGSSRISCESLFCQSNLKFFSKEELHRILRI